MVIAFTSTKKPYGWLGNMSPHPVFWKGEKYRTAEHLFQALRFGSKADGIVQEIRECTSPMRAKWMAKSYTNEMVVAPTSPVDVLNMDTVVRLKLAYNVVLIGQLLETGDEELIEDVTARPGGRSQFWGASLLDLGDKQEWVGENVLGKIWMRVREQLRDGWELPPRKQ